MVSASWLACVSRRVPQRGLLRRASTHAGNLCNQSPSAWTSRKCNQSPDAWPGCLPTFRDRSPDVLARGIFNRSPDAIRIRGSFETATNGPWFQALHHIAFPSFLNDGGYSIYIHQSSPLLRIISPELALPVNLPTAPL